VGTSVSESPLFSCALRQIFNDWKQGEIVDRLEGYHKQLLERRKYVIKIASQREPKKHTTSNCLVLQQVLLHRAERLLAGAASMFLENNIYGLALIVRGHYEATGVLGYLCNRLESLEAGNIKFGEFAINIASAIVGAKHPQFAKAPPPPNILTCIVKADKYLDSYLFKEKKGMLRDGYDWLSEFVHPNFCSNCSSFTNDKANRRFVFRHDGGIQESDFDLIGYLKISAGLFICLFDHSTRRLTTLF
jgi:hypothetical protein